VNKGTFLFPEESGRGGRGREEERGRGVREREKGERRMERGEGEQKRESGKERGENERGKESAMVLNSFVPPPLPPVQKPCFFFKFRVQPC
jgi:hypothetical protein